MYPRRWGHRTLFGLLVGVAGAYAAIRVARESTALLVTVMVLTPVMLLPYRAMAIAALERTVRAGLDALAAEWSATVRQDAGSALFELTREAGGRSWWIGNVLTHARSLHPGVKKAETWRMLGYVVRLGSPQSFACSLMKGWTSPRYFEREWRETSVMQGDFMALSWNGLLDDTARGRETGGKPADLKLVTGFDDPRCQGMAVAATDADRFRQVFSGELLEALAVAASVSLQFELNITPTSANVYHIYAGAAVQRRNLALLEKVVERLDAAAAAQPGPNQHSGGSHA